MIVRLLRVTALYVPQRLRKRQHVRVLVSGPVERIDKDGGQAVVRVADWEFEPVCRHCGGPI